jgi:hypothetical protein
MRTHRQYEDFRNFANAPENNRCFTYQRVIFVTCPCRKGLLHVRDSVQITCNCGAKPPVGFTFGLLHVRDSVQITCNCGAKPPACFTFGLLHVRHSVQITCNCGAKPLAGFTFGEARASFGGVPALCVTWQLHSTGFASGANLV